jgi:hypothetical protein
MEIISNMGVTVTARSQNTRSIHAALHCMRCPSPCQGKACTAQGSPAFSGRISASRSSQLWAPDAMPARQMPTIAYSGMVLVPLAALVSAAAAAATPAAPPSLMPVSDAVATVAARTCAGEPQL